MVIDKYVYLTLYSSRTAYVISLILSNLAPIVEFTGIEIQYSRVHNICTPLANLICLSLIFIHAGLIETLHFLRVKAQIKGLVFIPV